MNADHSRWTKQLSAYLDGEMGWDEQAQLEAHLSECAGCAATLNDLRRVVARADGLEDLPPQRDLWAGILEGLEGGGATGSRAGLDVVDIRDRGGRPRVGGPLAARPWQRRFSLSIPQLAAASIAMILLSASAAWLAVSSSAGLQSTAGGDPAAVAAGTPVSAALPGLDRQPGVTLTGNELPLVVKYESAIADLEEALQLGESTLDVETLATLRRSLDVIDRAIDEAREALEADPNSAYLNSHLTATMRQKMNLLRYANHFATAQS